MSCVTYQHCYVGSTDASSSVIGCNADVTTTCGPSGANLESTRDAANMYKYPDRCDRFSLPLRPLRRTICFIWNKQGANTPDHTSAKYRHTPWLATAALPAPAVALRAARAIPAARARVAA